MIASPRRAGVTFLEVQVAIVVLGVVLAGIIPLVMMQQKLLYRIESTAIGSDNPQVIRGSRIIDGSPVPAAGIISEPPVAVLQPSSDLWVRRLGLAAPFQSSVKSSSLTQLLTESSIDDASATITGTWATQSQDDATNGSCRVLAMAVNGAKATWDFGTITPGTYRLMICWPVAISIPSDAQLVLTSGTATQTVSLASATQPNSDAWRDAGNVTLGSTLQVSLSGSLVGPVVADSIRIGVRNEVTISPLLDSDSPSSSLGMARRANVVRKP